MNSPRLFLALSFCLLAGMVQAQHILTLNCAQMDAYLGKRFEVRVNENGSGLEVGRKTIPSVESAGFSIVLYVLLAQKSYTVSFYADVNENDAYDPPPTDHAWQRMTANVMQDVEINFIPDTLYTDTAFPGSFPYSHYDARWGGRWMNLTFGSTDSIQALFEVTCDSVFFSFVTAGVFGNPDPVGFDFGIPLASDFDRITDTLRFLPSPPWTGEIFIINGELHGDLEMSGIGLSFTGTVGLRQMMGLYLVTTGGNPLATGFFYVRELNIMASTPELNVRLEEIEHNLCSGSDNGEIQVAGIGGTPDYSFLWSNGDSTAMLTDLLSGEYCVTVTDAEGCIAASCFVITEQPPITLDAIVFDACAHQCSGAIDVTVSGGQPGFVLFWNNGFIGEDPVNLCAGEYSVNVLDANGCQEVFQFIVDTLPDIIFDDIQVAHATNGQQNGIISVVVSGGEPPYLYSLDGTAFQTSNIFLGLPAGTYCVYVIDNLGCEKKSEVFEILNVTSVDALKTSFNFYPNPVSSQLYIEADSPVSVKIMDMHGNARIQTPFALRYMVTVDLPPGIYLTSVTDGVDTVYRKCIVSGE